MGGGLLQIVAYGAQDIYITGNPQITFFKVVYRRHTNFAVESIQQTFNQQANFGRNVSATISRNGDLIHRMLLEVVLPKVDLDNVWKNDSMGGSESGNWTRWVNYLGHAMIKSAEIEIGGQKIDKHYGEWLHIWNQLTMEAGHEAAYHRMIGNLPELIIPRVAAKAVAGGVGNDESASGNLPATTPATYPGLPERVLQIPLQFWFCRNPGLALPLIALQYHEVKLHVQFRDLKECLLQYNCTATGSGCCKYADNILCTSTCPSVNLSDVSLYVDYIFLDTDERRRFAQLSHEYLIEQVQRTTEHIAIGSCSAKISLPFNHPVKELIWVAQKNEVAELRQHFNYTTGVSPFFYGGNNDANRFIGEAVAERLLVGIDSYSKVNRGWDGTSFGTPPTTTSWETNFNYPTDPESNDAAWNDPFVISMDHSYIPQNLIKQAHIKFNGQNRFSNRRGDYFNYTQPYYHHTRTPAAGINVYSFALRPEEHQPSGSCNFSRMDNSHIHLRIEEGAHDNKTFQIVNGAFIDKTCTPSTTTTNTTKQSPVKVTVYAVNYNVLRIMSGLGGLAYSN